METSTIQSLLLFIFPLFFLSTWIGTFFLLSQISGWNTLAQKYRCESPSFVDYRAWCWGKFGMVGYRKCLWVGVSAEGLYIKTGPLFFFSAFHPPLLIPWSKVSSVEEGRYFWLRTVELKLDELPNQKILLEFNVLEGSQRFLGTKLKLLEQKK